MATKSVAAPTPSATVVVEMSIDQRDNIDYAKSNISALADMLQVAAESKLQLTFRTLSRIGQMLEREIETIESNLDPGGGV